MATLAASAFTWMAEPNNDTAPAPRIGRGSAWSAGKLRRLFLPLAALAVIAGIATAGVAESRPERAATCGLAITVQDPDVRASLIRFDRQQSPAARKVCDLNRAQH